MIRHLNRARPLMALLALVVLACGSNPQSPSPASQPTAMETNAPGPLAARLDAIDAAVGRWQSATDLTTARGFAEETRNLIVGPDGPAYGDADGDGMVGGASAIGLLRGLGGEPGIATAAAGPCIERDVLGGSWADPEARWSILASAIAAWTPSDNTFPALPSHAQRIVGWATLALASVDLETAVKCGGHAHLHIDVSMRAVTDCAG